jgi:type IV pilus modification protein PilV
MEVLVTLTITAVALLGAAGLQLRAMQTGQSSQARTQAVLLVADLAEKMEANKQEAIKGSYLFDSANAGGNAADCNTGSCSGPDLAAYDLSQWSAHIKNLLPQATSWHVRSDSNAVGLTIYTIAISWSDRKVNTTYDPALTGEGEILSYQATRTLYQP